MGDMRGGWDGAGPRGGGSVAVGETRVVSVFNHAGGAGKTSATRDLGYVLAEEGFSVLLIDADAQANLTRWLGVEEQIGLERTLYAAVLGDGREGGSPRRELPEPVRVHGLDLIPSTLDLALLERQLGGVPAGELRLRHVLRRADISYDFVLIDCPPSLGELAGLGVCASDHVLVPVPTTIKGLEGIYGVERAIGDFREASPDLEVAMYLLTRYDARVNHHKATVEALHAELAGIVPVSGPLSERPAVYADASDAGVPVPAYKPNSEADREIREAARTLALSLGVKAHG